MSNFSSLFYKPKKRDVEIKKKRWSVTGIIWKALKRVCMAFGVMFLISLVMLTISTTLIMKGSKPAALPKDMVLLLELEGGFSEMRTKASFMDPFPFSKPTLRDAVKAIENATNDNRVRGIVVSVKSGGVALPHTQEIRKALSKFKESGKFTKIYAPSYSGNGLGLYYFASAFDEIWMQPVGQLTMTGMNMEMPFGKEALDKLGVNPDFFQREGFKSAMENLTNSKMSAKNREMLSSIVDDLSKQMVTQVAKDREVSPAFIKQKVDLGLLTGREALDAKLVDRLDYVDVLASEIRQATMGDPEDENLKFILLGQYAQAKKTPSTPAEPAQSTKSNIALIYAVGTIVDETGNGGSAGADDISAAIREAYMDDTIEAIVLRVDSPGGSPSASETIRRALVKAKEKGKKVTVSMGTVAASGGYWISADADEIVALPSTLTGSIGVIMGKFEISALSDKLGINWETIKYGENSDIFSVSSPFDEAARARMTVLIDDVYDAFLTRVSEGRGMTKAEVRNVAQGRAWTGAQALDIGLVDELGGLNHALDRTAIMLGKENRKSLNVIQIPRQKSAVEEFIALLEGQVSIGHTLQQQSKWLDRLNVLSEHLDIMTRAPEHTVYDAELEALR